MIFGYILSGMIDLFNVAFGITVGMVWSRSQRAGMAVLALTIALLALMQFGSGIGNLSGFFLATCAVSAWAWITFLVAIRRQKAAEAVKASQTLKP